MLEWATESLARYQQLRAIARSDGTREVLRSSSALADTLIDAVRVLEANLEHIAPRPVQLALSLPCAFHPGASSIEYPGTLVGLAAGGLVIDGLPPLDRGAAGVTEVPMADGAGLTLICDVVSQQPPRTALAISVLPDEQRFRLLDLIFTRLDVAEVLLPLMADAASRPVARRRKINVSAHAGLTAESLPRLLELRGFQVVAGASEADVIVTTGDDLPSALSERREGAALVVLESTPRRSDDIPPAVFYLDGPILPSRAAELVAIVDDVLDAAARD